MNASPSSWGSRSNLKAFNMRCQPNGKNYETSHRNISIFYLQNFTFCFLKWDAREGKGREGQGTTCLRHETCPAARCGSRTSLSNADCAQQLWKGFRVRVWFLRRSKYNYQRQKTENLKRFESSREPERRRRDRKVKVKVAQSLRRRRRSFYDSHKKCNFLAAIERCSLPVNGLRNRGLVWPERSTSLGPHAARQHKYLPSPAVSQSVSLSLLWQSTTVCLRNGFHRAILHEILHSATATATGL